MRITVLGTGMVGRALAGRMAELGHDVVVGTRDPQVTTSRADDRGGPSFADWLAQHPSVRLATFADAAAHGELLVNATSGSVSADALDTVGAEHLAGKVLLDISNDLDFSNGFPPLVGATSEQSHAERLQARYPQVRIVKALNTMNADLMVHPEQLAGGEHTVFVSGDDAAAKAEVVELLESFGWRDVIDLGALATARGTELMMPIWLSIWQALGGSPSGFQFRVVR